MAKGSYSRKSLLGLTVSICLIFSVTNLAFGASSDYLDDRKKIEEKKAKEYQKSFLNFDYEKIKNKDKGFKSPEIKDVKKKQIIRPLPANFKIIHSK